MLAGRFFYCAIGATRVIVVVTSLGVVHLEGHHNRRDIGELLEEILPGLTVLDVFRGCVPVFALLVHIDYSGCLLLPLSLQLNNEFPQKQASFAVE